MVTKATLMKQRIELQEIEGMKEQLLMMNEFNGSFVKYHDNMQDGNGEKEYDKTDYKMLNGLPIMKKCKLKTNQSVADDKMNNITTGSGTNDVTKQQLVTIYVFNK